MLPVEAALPPLLVPFTRPVPVLVVLPPLLVLVEFPDGLLLLTELPLPDPLELELRDGVTTLAWPAKSHALLLFFWLV